MRYFVTLVSLLFVFALAAAEKKPSFIGTLLIRSISVESSDGRGSGVIVAQGFVLTNFHILHEGSDVKVDGKPARVVKVDLKNDLALLSTETIAITVLKLAQEVTQDDEVICLGNPLQHKKMISRGRIVSISADGTLYTDAHIFFGSSGGGVFSQNGELVGVVRAIEGKVGDGFPYGVIVPASIIRTFLNTKRSPDLISDTELLVPLK